MKTYIESVVERFNALHIVERIRAYLHAAETLAFDPESRRRAVDEALRLREEMKTPGPAGSSSPHVRLGRGEEYLCTTISGIPTVIRHEVLTPEEEAAEIAEDEEFEMARKVAAWKTKDNPVEINPHDAGVKIDERFHEKTCVRCGKTFETQTPTLRHVCAECSGYVVASAVAKPVGRPTEAGPDSNLSRGDRLSHLLDRKRRP